MKIKRKYQYTKADHKDWQATSKAILEGIQSIKVPMFFYNDKPIEPLYKDTDRERLKKDYHRSVKGIKHQFEQFK